MGGIRDRGLAREPARPPARGAPVIAVILAAGQGKRMRSDQAKVLHRMAGLPLVEHVVRACLEAGAERQIVVIGHGRDAVRAALRDYPVEFVVQEEQRGTGHAALMAEPLLRGVRGEAVILCGDAPLIRPETLRAVGGEHRRDGNAATVVTAVFEDATGYGRIAKGPGGELLRIVEHRDATEEERAVCEVNSGAYCFSLPELFEALVEVTPENAQREFYLTDVIDVLRSRGLRVGTYRVADAAEIAGVNTPGELEAAESAYRGRRCEHCRRGGSREDALELILVRGRHAYLALAREPYNSGHCLVAPYRHAGTLEALGAEAVAEVLDLAARAEAALARAYKPEGYNMGTNTGAAEGGAGDGAADDGAESVEGESAAAAGHLIWHVIPRWCGDTNFMAAIGGTKVLPESLDRTFERLREALASLD